MLGKLAVVEEESAAVNELLDGAGGGYKKFEGGIIELKRSIYVNLLNVCLHVI